MAGLQLIAPTVSMLCVSSSVRAPRRAAASAASTPACPPPTTITSYLPASFMAAIVGRLRPGASGNGMLGPVPHRKLALFALLSMALVPAARAAQASGPGTTLAFSPCRLEHPLGLISLEAECGRLSVPENRQAPAGRKLQLFVARLPSLSRRHSPAPLFILAGGPGLGASTFYTTASSAFTRIRRNHDIVIVDQRGTGKSHPLNCPIDEQQLWDASEADTARIMGECRKRLEGDHDLSQYTSSVAVQDLDAVRQAMGYQRIALYGSSYGTRVAQHYARRFPANTLALILDGVVPPTQVLGVTTPLDAEDSLQRIFARCRAEPACFRQFGDPAVDYRQLRDKLAAAPVAVTLPNPRSGLPTPLQFSAAAFAGALRLSSYSSDRAALLPLTLHLANREAQYTPLASQYLLASAGYDAVLAYGMHNSVVCTEDVPFFASPLVNREKLAATFLGNSQLDALQALCREWPRGPMDPDFHQPLSSRVPALLLSGSADPVTPEYFADEAARGFTQALRITLPGQGHGQLLQNCIDRIMADFLQVAAAGRTLRVDQSCASKLKAAPFFLSLNGPAP
ncbi:MAG: alpha/beta fold hydrolase [Lysobacter sp.]